MSPIIEKKNWWVFQCYHEDWSKPFTNKVSDWEVNGKCRSLRCNVTHPFYENIFGSTKRTFSYCCVLDYGCSNSEGVQENCCQSLKVDLATLDSKQELLKKEFEQLGIQKERIHHSILEIDEIIANKQNDVSRLRKEHVIIAQTTTLTDVDVKTLETLQEALRTQCDELACLVWMWSLYLFT